MWPHCSALLLAKTPYAGGLNPIIVSLSVKYQIFITVSLCHVVPFPEISSVRYCGSLPYRKNFIIVTIILLRSETVAILMVYLTEKVK